MRARIFSALGEREYRPDFEWTSEVPALRFLTSEPVAANF